MSDRQPPVFILSSAVANVDAAQARADLPEFRKATQPMLLVADAIDQALAHLPEPVKASMADWGLVVGVDHGELEVTKDFLCTLKSRGMARPFLFQNSLHNATLGFLSLHLGLTGPGATTSTGFFGGEDALDLACDYVRAGAADVCFAVGVEALDAEMVPAAQELLGPSARTANGGAVVVVASGSFVALHGLEHGPRLATVTSCRRPAKGADAVAEVGHEIADGFYGANAIEMLARRLADTAWTAGRDLSLRLGKPDGSHSTLVLTSGALTGAT